MIPYHEIQLKFHISMTGFCWCELACVVARQDRDRDNTKGVVLNDINNDTYVNCIMNSPFTDIQIEATTAVLTLPNTEQLQVTVIYQSPTVTVSMLLLTMATTLDSLSLDMTSIIVGDFNDDLKLLSSTSMLQILMSSHKYFQLVVTATTNNGSILDHVYCNRPCECQRVSALECMV